jgi:hypothetical protein
MGIRTRQPGEKWTAADANAVLNMAFDVVRNGAIEPYDGHQYQIPDSWLDDLGLKKEWGTLRDEFLVSHVSGLTVRYNGGQINLPDGTFLTVAAGNLALPNNATSHIFINDAGQVAAAVTPDRDVQMLAIVTTVNGTISGAIIDRRRGFVVRPNWSNVLVFGGNGIDGDYLMSGTDALVQAELLYKTFNITATGAVTSAQGLIRIHTTRDLTIAGSLTLAPSVTGGGANGRGMPGYFTANPAGGFSFGRSGFGGGAYPSFAVSPVGSGGASGDIWNHTGGGGRSGAGGLGGSGLELRSAGAIRITGTIVARGGDATAAGLDAGTPSVGGSGGGSGGVVVIRSRTSITVSGTIDVRGGSGGAAFGTTGTNGGGGGGGGGFIVLIAPSINTTGATFLLTGGTGGAATTWTTGTSSYNAAGGGGGGAGGAGGNQGGAGGATGGIGKLITLFKVPF